MKLVELAAEKLAEGYPVLIHDSADRENEVDIVYRADAVTPEVIRMLRRVAGGLICFVTRYEYGKLLGIDLQSRLLKKLALDKLVKLPGYGDEPAFSIWVNHVKVRTGIRDVDRALTIRELAKVVSLIESGKIEVAREMFYSEFYSPGHVPILLGRINERRGHTELSLMLAEIAKIPSALVICEVLGDSTDIPSLDELRELAKSLNTVLLEGSEIEKYYVKTTLKR